MRKLHWILGVLALGLFFQSCEGLAQDEAVGGVSGKGLTANVKVEMPACPVSRSTILYDDEKRIDYGYVLAYDLDRNLAGYGTIDKNVSECAIGGLVLGERYIFVFAGGGDSFKPGDELPGDYRTLNSVRKRVCHMRDESDVSSATRLAKKTFTNYGETRYITMNADGQSVSIISRRLVSRFEVKRVTLTGSIASGYSGCDFDIKEIYIMDAPSACYLGSGDIIPNKVSPWINWKANAADRRYGLCRTSGASFKIEDGATISIDENLYCYRNHYYKPSHFVDLRGSDAPRGTRIVLRANIKLSGGVYLMSSDRYYVIRLDSFLVNESYEVYFTIKDLGVSDPYDDPDEGCSCGVVIDTGDWFYDNDAIHNIHN